MKDQFKDLIKGHRKYKQNTKILHLKEITL